MTVAKAATIMKCQEKLKQERSTVTVAAPEAREARLCACAAVKSIPKFCAFINDMGANPRWTKESARKCMLIYRALEREFLEQNPDCARPPADGLYYFERVDFFARFVDFHEPQHGERNQRELFQFIEELNDAEELERAGQEEGSRDGPDEEPAAAIGAETAELGAVVEETEAVAVVASRAAEAAEAAELKALAASKEAALEEVAMLKERIAAVEGGVAAHKQELDVARQRLEKERAELEAERKTREDAESERRGEMQRGHALELEAVKRAAADEAERAAEEAREGEAAARSKLEREAAAAREAERRTAADNLAVVQERLAHEEAEREHELVERIATLEAALAAAKESQSDAATTREHQLRADVETMARAKKDVEEKLAREREDRAAEAREGLEAAKASIRDEFDETTASADAKEDYRGAEGLALKIPHEGDGDALNELMMLKSLQCTAFVVKLIVSGYRCGQLVLGAIAAPACESRRVDRRAPARAGLEHAQGDLEAYMDLRKSSFRAMPSVRPFHDVLAGVEYLHAHGILHLDLKPKNVLWFQSETTGEDLFKLCDFGSAREYSSSDVEFTGAGTPPFQPFAAIEARFDGRAPASPVGGYDDDSVSFADVIDEFTFVGMWPELTKRLSSEDPDDVYNFLRDDDCDAEEERDAINDAINRDRAQMVAQKVDEVLGAASPTEPSNELLSALGRIAIVACSEKDADRPSAIVAYRELLAAVTMQSDRALDNREAEAAAATAATAARDAEAATDAPEARAPRAAKKKKTSKKRTALANVENRG
ncbi:hypothetical protein JL720_13702 [Aureococcus anophagefferens]|nr:hypothetical protein JL720_13702 [Aureococcus anophagefferens]